MPKPGDIAIDEKGYVGLIYYQDKDGFWCGLNLTGVLAIPAVPWRMQDPKVLFNVFELARQMPPWYCPNCRSEMQQVKLPEHLTCKTCGFNGYPYDGTRELVVRANWDEVRGIADYAQRLLRGAQAPIEAMRSIGSFIGRLRRERRPGWPPVLHEDSENEKGVRENQPPPPDKEWRN